MRRSRSFSLTRSTFSIARRRTFGRVRPCSFALPDRLAHSPFLAGLAQFVKTSRRPVIMTCTGVYSHHKGAASLLLRADLSLIPFDELALQKIVLGPDLSTLYLEFASPAKELAVPFLELVALSEGHIIPREHLLHLYDSDSRPPRHPAWLTHGPADAHPHPNPSSPAPEPDLRRALAQLQFECQWAIGDRMGGIGWMDFTPERDERTAWSAGTYRTVPPPPLARMDQDGEDVLAATVVAAEALSFADAFLARRTATHLEVRPHRFGILAFTDDTRRTTKRKSSFLRRTTRSPTSPSSTASLLKLEHNSLPWDEKPTSYKPSKVWRRRFDPRARESSATMEAHSETSG